MATCWKLLGIKSTSDIAAIKKAYARQAAIRHPEDNPEGFSLLHEAYLEALAKAERTAKFADDTEQRANAASESPESPDQSDEPNDAPPSRFSFSVTAEQSKPEAAPSLQFSFAPPASGSFEEPAPTPQPAEDPAARVRFPKHAWQTTPEQSAPPVQPLNVETPLPGAIPQQQEAMPNNEPAHSFPPAERLHSARQTVLNLLHRTRKAFPQSVRRNPWEYVVARPEFAAIRLDVVFLEALIATLQTQSFPSGIWPVLTDAYASELYSPANDQTPSDNEAQRVTILVAQLREEIDKHLKGEPAPLSWQEKLGAFFTGNRKPAS